MFRLLGISKIKGSTHTIYWLTNGTKKVTWTIHRPNEKKLKKYWKVAIELSINDNTSNPQI